MSEWIDVRDRLPEERVHVLAYSMYRKAYAEDWQVGGEWFGHSSWNPTHWMPLPEPPK